MGYCNLFSCSWESDKRRN